MSNKMSLHFSRPSLSTAWDWDAREALANDIFESAPTLHAMTRVETTMNFIRRPYPGTSLG